VRERAADCVITTSPPESTHLVGLLLGNDRPAWIADFRDGWTFESHRARFPTGPQRAVDEWLESKVVRNAEVVVGVTPQIADDLSQRLGAQAHWIPNGWEQGSAQPAVHKCPSPGAEGVKRLVYTGRLSGPWGRTPESFFHALRLVQAKAPLRLVHAGSLSNEDRQLIETCGVADLVEHVGFLDRFEVTALQQSADALLLITSRNSSEATGKIFEYLAAGRPILALAQESEAARIVTQTHTGIVVPPDDVGEIVAALGRVSDGELAADYEPTGVERYSYPFLAEEMSEAIEEAVARSAG
jgi:glycosyltransferase involved in cell wall biosynthesis